MHRRTVLQVATTAGLAAALPALHHAPQPARITASYVDRLHERTTRLRRLDDVLGGGDTCRVYLGEVQRTKALLARGSFTGTDVRTRLTGLLAEQAQQAGWAFFDGGHPKEAAALYEESRLYAREAGDADLYGNSLAFLAYKTLPDDRHTAVAFARDSCETITARTPATVRALLYERLAWACAVDGQAGGTEAALVAARESLDDAQDGEPQPDWSVWVDRTELGIMTGRCWTELRRPCAPSLCSSTPSAGTPTSTPATRPCICRGSRRPSSPRARSSRPPRRPAARSSLRPASRRSGPCSGSPRSSTSSASTRNCPPSASSWNSPPVRPQPR